MEISENIGKTNFPKSESDDYQPAIRIGTIIFQLFSPASPFGWVDGRIQKSFMQKLDRPYAPNQSLGRLRPIDWMAGLLSVLDEHIPDQAILEAALDLDSYIISDQPVASLIPETPDVTSAGQCLLGARVLIKSMDDLIPPYGASMDELKELLEQISCVALMLGGEGAFLSAMTINQTPVTYAPIRQVAGVNIELHGADL